MKRLLSSFFLALTTVLSFAQSAPVSLYTDKVPNAKPTPTSYIEKTDGKLWITQVSIPTITPYLPEKNKANGTAVIICPGGAYAGLASGHEGADVARAFSRLGIAAFVLKYRLPSDLIMQDKSIGPLQDAQRAIQLVRERAAKYGVNINRVGIMGFSAGGHLASTAATHFDKAVIDNPHQTNLRPDFAVLLYPVITFGTGTHQGSKENLIGNNPEPATIELYSNEKQVTPQTPPAFLVHAEDDTVVPVQNSLQFYEAMVKAGVKGEVHIYEKGGHGFGMNNPTTADKWFDRMVNWMQMNGWLNK